MPHLRGHDHGFNSPRGGFGRARNADACVFSAPSQAGICDATTALAKAGCDQQATSRFSYNSAVCLNHKSLAGKAAYDPPIDPADFSTIITNPLMPLKPGNVWVYQSGDAEVTVTVTAKTITLNGVTCVVVHDVNKVNGVIEEDTFDYYAQHKDGTVWYFGEDTISFGNNPKGSTKGSWRYGVAGAKPGFVMQGHPQPGKTYRQEFRLGVAEDMARNVAAIQRITVPFGTFHNAYQIHEFTPLEPLKSEDKYYIPGVGLALAVDLAGGDREELVSFTPGP